MVLREVKDPDYHSFAFETSGWITNVATICHPTYSGNAKDEIQQFHWNVGDIIIMRLNLSK